MCHASYSCSKQGISSQFQQLQWTENYAHENQQEKLYVRKIIWLFLYGLIWNDFFPLIFFFLR